MPALHNPQGKIGTAFSFFYCRKIQNSEICKLYERFRDADAIDDIFSNGLFVYLVTYMYNTAGLTGIQYTFQ